MSGNDEQDEEASVPLKSREQTTSLTSGPGRKDSSSSSSLCAPLPATTSGDGGKTGKFIYILAFFSAIGGFLFGYDTGVVSGAMLIIRKEMDLSTGWHEAIVSGTIAAAWLFALIGGYLSDRLGRKPVILAASVVFAVGSIVMGAANGKEALLAGRIIVGIGIGWMSSVCSVYIAEASPTAQRGRLVGLQSVFITLGRFCGAMASAVAFSVLPPTSTGRRKATSIIHSTTGKGLASMSVPMFLAEAAPAGSRGLLVTLNVSFITGGQAVAAIFSGALSTTADGWRYMLGIAAIPALVQLIGFFMMPESPRWLVSHGKLDEARKVLQRIRGPLHNIEEELEAIKSSAEETERELGYRRQRGQTSNVLVQIMQSPPVRRALFLGCLLQMFQQIAGINTVMYYSATIIQMAGFWDTSKAIWLSALVASVNFLCTFLGLYLVEKVGRRRLTLGSLLGVVLSLAFLAVGFIVVDSNSYPVTEFYHDQNNLCSSAVECNECNSIAECGFCFTEDATLGVTRGSCLLSKENQTSLSDYGPCNNLSISSSLSPSISHQDEANFIYSYGWCPSPHGWITVLGLMTYLLFFAPGMGPMPWTINAEIYPLWARSTCNSIATSTNWFFNFLVSMTFLTLTEILTRQGAFLFYSGLAATGLLLFWWLLPETKGRSLEEMEVLFSIPRKCPTLWKPKKSGSDLPDSDECGPNKTVQYVQIRGLNRDRKDPDEDDD